jgi:hypothetical protein
MQNPGGEDEVVCRRRSCLLAACVVELVEMVGNVSSLCCRGSVTALPTVIDRAGRGATCGYSR